MMALSRVTAPPVLPVTLAALKARIRQDDDAEDDFLTAQLNQAVQRVDGVKGSLGRALIEQVWDWTLDRFPSPDMALRLPLPPHQTDAVIWVKYIDSAGAQQTWDAAEYDLRAYGDEGPAATLEPVYGGSWPTVRNQPSAVTIRFTAGYSPGTGSPVDYAENVPEPIKQAILMYAAGHDAVRSPVAYGSGVSEWVEPDRLLAPYRLWFPRATVRRVSVAGAP